MKSPVKIFVIAVLLVVFLISYIIIGNKLTRLAGFRETALELVELLSLYIEENNGKFPSSETELIKEGYLKIEKEDGEYHYYRKIRHVWDSETIDALRSEGRDISDWQYIVDLNRWKINYGVDIKDIELAGFTLYSKGTKEKILLIDGPHWYAVEYKKLSRDLYNEMLRFQKDKIAETINSDKKIEQ